MATESSPGRGDAIWNSWIRNPHYLGTHQTIEAFKLRVNMVPTRIVMAKAGGVPHTCCRHCNQTPPRQQSLAHILGDCTFSKKCVRSRHDDIVKQIVGLLERQKDVSLAVEQTIQVKRSMFKPDIICYNSRTKAASIIDVTVRYEQQAWVDLARREKIDKYTKIVAKVKSDFAARRATVVPLVFGVRGALHQTTLSELRKLGIGERSHDVSLEPALFLRNL